MEQALEETLGGHRTQDTENQLFWILSVSVSEFDIMVLGMITVAATAVTSLVFIVSLGCCLFFCGSRRYKRTRKNVYREHNRYEYYRAHYYANKLQLNNENEHDTKNNGTNQQHETVNEDKTLQTET